MSNPIEALTIAGRACRLYEHGEGGPLLLQPVGEDELSALEHQLALTGELSGDAPFAYAGFLIGDWNHELTPWPAPPVFGKADFKGRAADTLSYVTDSLLPELTDRFGSRPVLLGGYSLGGLFSLWAATRANIFQGVAGVSPSVWYPGWLDYLEANPLQAKAVYLSLGDAEADVRNIMATAADNLRSTDSLVEQTAGVTAHLLEWNPGNHFREPDLRTAKGFAWLLRQIYDPS